MMGWIEDEDGAERGRGRGRGRRLHHPADSQTLGRSVRASSADCLGQARPRPTSSGGLSSQLVFLLGGASSRSSSSPLTQLPVGGSPVGHPHCRRHAPRRPSASARGTRLLLCAVAEGGACARRRVCKEARVQGGACARRRVCKERPLRGRGCRVWKVKVVFRGVVGSARGGAYGKR